MISSKKFLATPDKNAGVKHFIGISPEGQAQSWGRNNFGQLGRPSSTTKTSKASSKQQPQPVECEAHLNRNSQQENVTANSSAPTTAANTNRVVFVKAYVGGASDSGHSALLDTDGHLWFAGCDRWQQLGLGSSAGGSAGYTWNQGRIWRNQFVKNDFLVNGNNDVGGIRDVSLGGDHTVILSKNQQDVFVFGKGGDGQLGVNGKPFVSAPTRSKVLSVPQTASYTINSKKIAAVCAIQHCSLTLDEDGNVMNQAGKCRNIQKSLEFCVRRAQRDGLLLTNTEK